MNLNMNKRLEEIIRYKTGGEKKAFATLLNWSPPYLSKLLKGVDFGLQPVISIIEAMPEINARWFLTGQGEMLNSEKQAMLRREAIGHVQRVMELERFIPVMNPKNSGRLNLKSGAARKPISAPTRSNRGKNA